MFLSISQQISAILKIKCFKYKSQMFMTFRKSHKLASPSACIGRGCEALLFKHIITFQTVIEYAKNTEGEILPPQTHVNT